MKELDKEQLEAVRYFFKGDKLREGLLEDYLKEKGLIEEFEGWRKSSNHDLAIAFFKNNKVIYGFDIDGKWYDDCNFESIEYDLEADSEGEAALITEAKERGYFDKKHTFNNDIRPKVVSLKYDPNWTRKDQCLYCTESSNVIWRSDNGWATIEEEKEFLIQVQKATIIIDGKEYTAEEIINKFNN